MARTKKCAVHPDYQAKRTPRTDCIGCWRFYMAKGGLQQMLKQGRAQILVYDDNGSRGALEATQSGRLKWA